MTFKTTFGRLKLGTQFPSTMTRDLTHLPTIEANPLAKPKEQSLPTHHISIRISCIFDNSVQNNLSK